MIYRLRGVVHTVEEYQSCLTARLSMVNRRFESGESRRSGRSAPGSDQTRRTTRSLSSRAREKLEVD